MHRWLIVRVIFIVAFAARLGVAATFVPDPASVQREGPAYRYPQAGWIVLHVEGEPYERGRQQGKLLSREIQDYVKCFAAQQSSGSPADAWALTRTLADSLFLRHFDPELLEEMKGIADGAAAAGAKFNGRPLDLTDIVAANVWPEIMSLDDALRAQPTGLETKDFDKLASNTKLIAPVSRCSAFAATGSATKDGKAIIGHITMFDLYPCNFFNVWIDVKPAKGHRVVFQGAPGSVQSGMDWYINDAGIVLTETTIRQTKFNPNGMSIGSRSRRAVQYGDNIESAVKLLGDSGNGLYTNEWLLADMKNNEIALFELGTNTSRLMRSSKNEWFGGTTGFYWGDNNVKDLDVRMETIAAANDRPADMTFFPEIRDKAWVQLYQQYKGKIDADFGKIAFSKPPLVSRFSCDAKFATADMALELKSFAHWGDPYGQLWEPSADTSKKYPDAAPIMPNDWTVLTPAAPPFSESSATLAAVDLKTGDDDDAGKDKNEALPPTVWHGTLLPATDADIWLTSAFARFHDHIAREKQLLKAHENGKEKPADQHIDTLLKPDERSELAVRLFGYRVEAMSEGAGQHPVALRDIKTDVASDAWFRQASGRGVMLLSELRRRLGAEKFDAAMDSFGRAHAGQPVDSAAFVAAMSKVGDGQTKEFFAKWLDSADVLPTLDLSSTSLEKKDSNYVVTGRVSSHGGYTPANVDVTIETEDGETTTAVPFASDVAEFHLSSDKKPTRLIVNKYGRTACTNGAVWNGSACARDLDHTLIIYGTRVEGTANRIAAEKLQRAVVDLWDHLALPIKPDTAVSDDDLRGHHILLIGRPECSALIEKLTASLPVKFGPRSFIAGNKLYANADSAVIAAGANSLDTNFSLVCAAGLSPSATLHAAKSLAEVNPAPLKILAAHQSAKDIVPPAPELTRELK